MKRRVQTAVSRLRKDEGGVQWRGNEAEAHGSRPARMVRGESGLIGAAPEWFYKGTGEIIKTHRELLDVPNHGDDGGDEAEIIGCYIIGPDAAPYRVGFVQGNEFSDHVMEAKNYLYLAASKLRSSRKCLSSASPPPVARACRKACCR